LVCLLIRSPNSRNENITDARITEGERPVINAYNQIMLRLCAKGWVAPLENAVQEQEYKAQLENAGFQVEFIKRIGDRVFPGYAKSFGQDSSKRNNLKMGRWNAMLFTMIGNFLGYAYKKGILSLEEAQQRAAEQIGAMRYGNEQKDYFWIITSSPIMIMHPYRPDLNGSSTQAIDSPCGGESILWLIIPRSVVRSGWM